MKSVFDNPKAFAPFFDDLVSIDGKRPDGRSVRCTVCACVLDQGFSDPLSDESTSSEARELVVQIPRCSWAYSTPPQIGDVVKTESMTLKVYKVDMFDKSFFSIHARQVV